MPVGLPVQRGCDAVLDAVGKRKLGPITDLFGPASLQAHGTGSA